MNIQTAKPTRPARRVLRSVGAVAAGMATLAIIAAGIDQVLHATGVFPPDGEPMMDPSLNALALLYRAILGVVGGAVTAWLAPYSPRLHALVLGVIGTALSLAGAVALFEYTLPWYSVAIVAICVPTALLGSVVHQRSLSSKIGK